MASPLLPTRPELTLPTINYRNILQLAALYHEQSLSLSLCQVNVFNIHCYMYSIYIHVLYVSRAKEQAHLYICCAMAAHNKYVCL